MAVDSMESNERGAELYSKGTKKMVLPSRSLPLIHKDMSISRKYIYLFLRNQHYKVLQVL